MSVIDSIKEKVATKLLGKLITDLGTLPTDKHGHQLSLSIRRNTGQPPHLQLKWEGRGEIEYRQIVCSREWAAQLEKVSQEMRKHFNGASAS